MNNDIAQPCPAFVQAKEPDFLALRVNRFYQERVRDTWGGRHILHGISPNKDAIHIAGNDYLSLARHPSILKAMSETMLNEGNGLLMSGIFLHGTNPQLALEDDLAQYMHAEAGVLCQSGWCANTGLIQSIANERTPVYADMLAHMSLWEGIRSAGAKPITFHHNDPEHLERQVLRHGPGVIVVDSVYSTNGSVCPLQEVVHIGNKHGCVLVVDESHSLGTHGPNGKGLVVALGLADQVHFRTASLAKAFAGRAGFIACPERFKTYFKFESNPAIFSSTLLPHEVVGIRKTMEIIQIDDWRRQQLRYNAAYLRRQLDGLGYNLHESQSQIIALEAGPEPQTIVLRDALEARGIFGSVFCAPATPKNRSLVRFSINSALTQAELERIVQICRDIREEIDMASWPSTRRKHARGAQPAADERIRQEGFYT